MSNVSVDVNASFNPIGDIKPLYVRLEDENHELHTYRIENVNSTKEEKYSGIQSRIFHCNISIEGCKKEITLRYYYVSHKWALIR